MRGVSGLLPAYGVAMCCNLAKRSPPLYRSGEGLGWGHPIQQIYGVGVGVISGTGVGVGKVIAVSMKLVNETTCWPVSRYVPETISPGCTNGSNDEIDSDAVKMCACPATHR